MKTSSSRIRGFSLIELLVVVFIIAIIATFVALAAPSILRGSQLAQGSQILADQVSLARQYALSKNHPVEVRFIRFADPEVPGEYDPSGGAQPTPNGNYRAIQILETMDAVDPTTGDFVRLPLDKPALLPQAIVMNQGVLSTLIKDASAAPNAPSKISGVAGGNDPQLPKSVTVNGKAVPVPYDYVYFRFLPDGSTNLPLQSKSDPNGAWCVTLQNINDPAKPNTPPPNFFTLQIDPVSGTIKQFRPGI